MEPTNPLGAAGTLPESAFPDEVFECPYCGQLLAPSCRVCVSCKLPIDPARIQRKAEAVAAAAAVEAKPEPPPVRFSWPIFFAVAGVSWLAAVIALGFLGLVGAQLLMSGAQIFSAVWVFWDARQKMVRKPLRWAVGSLLLWLIFFPWYLARRKKLDAPCPFVESESGPFTRVMILAVFIFFLVGIIVSLVSGPAPKSKPGSPSESGHPINSLKN
jgi:hypothetical protein